MDKKIRSMIDALFVQMQMTAENLALRDEMMANALERYEDNLAQGRSEEQAFAEVAASLGDVQAMLEEMNAMSANAAGQAQPEQEAKKEEAGQEEPDQAETTEAAQQADGSAMPDIGEALSRAFSALGGFGQTIMPEAKKFVGQMDDVSGGMLSKLGKATKKGLRSAQKAAGEAIDRLSRENGELVIDFGANCEARQDENGEEKAEAEPEGKLENEMEESVPECEVPAEEAAQPDQGAPYMTDDGEIDQEVFAREVDDLARDAQEAIQQAAKMVREKAPEAESDDVRDDDEPRSSVQYFPADGLRRIDVQLDADDVEILSGDGERIEIYWEAKNVEGEPVITCDQHELTICRKNPDVFKKFFSVFEKECGGITVRVPRGFAANIAVSTISGNVSLRGVDMDDAKVKTISGSVRIEPDSKACAKNIAATTVSGHVTIRACADTISVSTVSGGQYIDCNAHRIDVNVVSGKAYVKGAYDEWKINAVSGKAELLCTAVPAKGVRISSVSSKVCLALPREIRGFDVEATDALGCKIVNDFGPNRYGDCSLPISVETVNGKLHITQL